MYGIEPLGEKLHLSKFREPFDGGIHALMLRQFEAQQIARRGNDQVQVYLKARTHRDAAIAGGGSREVARRARQLAKIAAK